MARTKYATANWKLNGSRAANAAWVRDFLRLAAGLTCDVTVAAPFVYLPELAGLFKDSPVKTAAEDVSRFDTGAYTGEVSAAMVADIGAGVTLVGHSERRSLFGDTDEVVAEKVKKALAAGLEVILCVGETLHERREGKTDEVVIAQTVNALHGLTEGDLRKVTLAYEPVWAIGTGETATPETAQAVHAALRAELARRFGGAVAVAMRILYGGSVKPANAAELFAMPDIDGALVGGASLKAEDFYAICAAAQI